MAAGSRTLNATGNACATVTCGHARQRWPQASNPSVGDLMAQAETSVRPSESDGYMRVAELRALLAEAADDLLVVLQKDAEGNGYSPLAGGQLALYVPYTTWSGDVPHPDDVADYLDAEGAESCVVLWPTN